MIKIENESVWGFENAVHSMRNPMNSWAKSDSHYEEGYYVIGDADLTLMKKLYRGGSEHRKFLRFIHVQMNVTAPLYWWKEFETYKVGVSSNSSSTMHKIMEKEFYTSDFSNEHMLIDTHESLNHTIEILNFYRNQYLKSTDIKQKKEYWWQVIQLLPSSYNQYRTIDINYENVVNIIHQRENHKLDEWRVFCYHLRELPQIRKIMVEDA